MLRPAKDVVRLRVPGLYRILIECGNAEILDTAERLSRTGTKDTKSYIRLHQPEKSAVADHIISTGHCFDFSVT